MKYLLMVIDDEPGLGPAEVDALLARHGEFGKALHAAGKWVASARLAYRREAVTVRPGRTPPVVDGPFAESKECIGGFYLIEADSKAEAVDWATRLPVPASGAVEVRPARTGATWRGTVRPGRQFMVMFIADAGKPLSRAELFQAIDAHYELSLDLAAQGKFVGSRALEPSASAATVRWRDGRAIVSDGPFAETREFVAGYFIIACDGKDEAVGWAEQLMIGSAACEVRPLWGSE
jgi:hypothetical protein